MAKPLKILAFWAASDYEEFFTPAFLNRPEYEVEIVHGHRTFLRSKNPMTLGRFLSLRRRVAAGDFDLVLSGNIWNTIWPGHKSFWTHLCIATRFLTYKRGMLDSWWAPHVMRGLETKVPFAVIDNRDPAYVLPWDWPLLKSAFLYFKRELFFWPQRSLGPLSLYRGKKHVFPMETKLMPFSFGIHPDRIPSSVTPMRERDVDIFISGFKNPVRDGLKERVRKLSSRYRVVVADFLDADEYEKMLQRAKLVVCTESFGWETWRQYDVAAAGAIPLLNWAYIQNHAQPQPDVHAIYFSLIADDFERQIARALANSQLLESMSKTARQYVIDCKARPKIADYVVSTTLERFHSTVHQ